MNVFYCPVIDSEEVSLDETESQHATRVLRLKAGDVIKVMNGTGLTCIAEIINPHHKKCEIKILERKMTEQRPVRLHIAIAPTKMNDRMEWFLEKATEIGIDEITPVICHRSERRQINNDRFQKVLIAAMKQSMNPWLPILNESTDFKKFIESAQPGFIAHCMDTPKSSFKTLLPSKEHVNILVGPEGDFSIDEAANALQRGWKAVSFGDSRLRTETAGLVACMIFNLLQY